MASTYIDLWAMLGYTNNALMMMETFEGSSNVITTDNPEYFLSTYQADFPVFNISLEGVTPETGQIPYAIWNLFYNMANASIKYDRYPKSWEYLMGLYISHYLVLYIRTQSGTPGAQAALQGALPMGIASSKSVDGLSVSYEFLGLDTDLTGYGTWKLTVYGQQLATLTKGFGHAGMWVNG